MQEFTIKRRLFVKTADQIKYIQDMTFEDHNRLLEQIYAVRSGEVKISFANGWRDKVHGQEKQGESFDYSMKFESNNESRRNSVPGRTGVHASRRQEYAYTQSKTSNIEKTHPIIERSESAAIHISVLGNKHHPERESMSKTDEDSILQPLTPRTINGFSKETDRSSLRKTSDLQIVKESQTSDLNTDIQTADKLQAAIEAVDRNIDSATASNAQLQDDLMKLQSELNKKQLVLADLERSLENHRKGLAAGQRELEQLNSTEQGLKERHSSVRESSVSHGGTSRLHDLASLQEKQEAVSSEIEETSKSIDARTNKMIELKSLLFKLEAEKSSKQRKMTDLDKDIADLQIKVAEKEKIIQEVRAAHSMKTSNKQKLLSELMTATTLIEELTAAIEQEVIIVTKPRSVEEPQNRLDDSTINVSQSFSRLLDASSRLKASTKAVHAAWQQLTGTHEDSSESEPELAEEEDCNFSSIAGLMKSLQSTLDKMARVTKNLETTKAKVSTWSLTSESISEVVDKQQQLSKLNLEKVEKIQESSQSIEKSLSELRDALSPDPGNHNSYSYKLSQVETKLSGFEADLLAFVQNIRREAAQKETSSTGAVEVEQPIKMIHEILEWFKNSFSKSQTVGAIK